MSITLQQLNDQISGTLRRIISGELKTFAPFLSLLRINGKSMNLSEHYQMLPMFKVRMPRKTVFMIARQLGKSTSICANTIIRSAFLPYFHTLMLQPRFDQVQRLNSTVLLPLLKGSSFKQFIPSEELRKFALKKFNNGSMIMLDFSYLSPDRTRGYTNVGTLLVDESISGDEMVIVYDKSTGRGAPKKISEITAGDVCLSFDFSNEHAIVFSVAAKNASFHSVRACFKLTTATGRTLECTADHALLTDKGRMRVSEVIEYEYRRRSQASRHDGASGECCYGEPDGGCSIQDIGANHESHPLEPRIVPKGVRPIQVPNIIRVRHKGTVSETESRLRRYVDCLASSQPWSISLYVLPNAPEQLYSKDYYTGVLRRDNASDSPGLVVHGRWVKKIRRKRREYCHQCLYMVRKRITRRLANDRVGYSCENNTSHKLDFWKGITDPVYTGRRLFGSLHSYLGICPRVHAIQSDSCVQAMRYMRDTVYPYEKCSGVLRRMSEQAEVPDKAAVLRGAPGGNFGEKCCMGSGAQGSGECCTQGLVCSTNTGAEARAVRGSLEMAEREPRTLLSYQESIPGSPQGRSSLQSSGSGSECTVLSESNERSGKAREALTTEQRGQEETGTQSPRFGVSEKIQGRTPGDSESPTGKGQCCPARKGSHKRRVQTSSECTSESCTGQKNCPDGQRGLLGCPKRKICSEVPGREEENSGTCTGVRGSKTGRDGGRGLQADETGSIYEGSCKESFVLCSGESEQRAHDRANGRERSLSGTPKGTVQEAAGEEKSLSRAIPADFLYDPIVSIEYTGEKPVYDIEVVGTHNYVLANGICSYNCQDVEHSFIPVFRETMSASRLWGFTIMTGTPKTTDTTLGLEWAACSQAEWVIRCTHCNYLNLPHPDHDLKKMIGLHGCICAKCGKLLNPINGTYVHAHPELSGTDAGYHISQVIHPMHCLYPTKWSDLLAKLKDYDEMMAYNEVFGWPYDNSVVPLTFNDLLNARNESRWSTPRDIPGDIKKKYRALSIGLDFDGGGALSDSFTSIAIVGLRKNSDVLDCLYAERIDKGHKVAAVCRYIMSWVQALNPEFVAYDAGGAGFVYKEMLEQEHCPVDKMIPYKYTSPGSGDIIRFHKGIRDDNSLYYSIDKSRSLAVIIEAIKAGKVTVPWFEDKATEFKHNTILDLLALVENPTLTRTNDPVYLIGRKAGIPDDFAHALNFACSAIWDKARAYPKLGRRYTTDSLDSRTLLSEGIGEITEEDHWLTSVDDDIFRGALDYGAAVYHNPGGFQYE